MDSPLGSPLRRKEDRRLVTGRGRYVEDLHFPGMAHAAFVRSPHAHARIKSINAEAAHKKFAPAPGASCTVPVASSATWVCGTPGVTLP